MGTKYEVKCEGCRYSAVVSGGRDVGRLVVVQTMTCDDCRELVDVVIGQLGENDPLTETGIDSDLGACPQCGSTKVVPWDEARHCPRCRSEMIPGGLFVNWD